MQKAYGSAGFGGEFQGNGRNAYHMYEGLGELGEGAFESAGLGVAPDSHHSRSAKLPFLGAVRWTEKCPQGRLHALPVWWTE